MNENKTKKTLEPLELDYQYLCYRLLGIPDFRSADGLYATLNPDLLTADPAERESIRNDPTVALEHNMFLQNPLPLLELQREFILGTHEQKWKATIAHRFVELLHSKTSKLVRLYTQNIDGLEDQCVQLPRDKVIAVHGSMDRAQCERCQSDMNYDDFCRKVKEQIKDLSRQDSSAPDESTAITCPTCGYNAMKPSIVLFRSSLPREFFESVPNDVKDTDLLLIIGTSLRVAPANSLVWRVPKTCLRLLVNREEVGDHLGMFAYKNFDDDDDKDDQDESDDDNNSTNINHKKGRDFFASGECDNILLQLIDKLGWINELKPLLEHKLPESSASVLSEYLKQAADKVVHSG
jgi:NAD+-dependent protein deacetylase sirtuin 2